ncbi:MAG: hypothetical protein AAB209_01960, partial [Bacteroidota bacterium]
MRNTSFDISDVRLPLLFYSVRTKLAALTSLLVALISVFIYWYFPTQLERKAMTAIAEKANSI